MTRRLGAGGFLRDLETKHAVGFIGAALRHDTYSAERTAKSNNAQIVTIGARTIGPEPAKEIVDTWFASTFDHEGPAGNVAAIDTFSKKCAKSI